MHKNLKEIEKRISAIKKELMTIGEMRPGSLTLQYQKPEEKQGAYYQISYTHHMKSRTQHVRPEFVDELKGQIETFKKFKSLVAEWTDLAIEHSITKIKIAKEDGKKVS